MARWEFEAVVASSLIANTRCRFSFSSPALFQAGSRWVSLCSVYLNHSEWMTVDSHSACHPCCEFWKSMHGSNTNSVSAVILELFFNITFTETLAIKELVTICANFRRWSRDYVISIALTRSWMEKRLLLRWESRTFSLLDKGHLTVW